MRPRRELRDRSGAARRAGSMALAAIGLLGLVGLEACAGPDAHAAGSSGDPPSGAGTSPSGTGAATPAGTGAAAPAKGGSQGSSELGWDELADFHYSPPAAVTPAERRIGLSPEMLALDGRSIELSGSVIPLDIQDGVVHSLVLCRRLWVDGVMPPSWSNEVWIDLDEANVLPSLPRQAVRFRGTLRVAEIENRAGAVTHVYRLEDARRVGGGD